MPDLQPVPTLADVPELGDGVVTLRPADARHAPALGALLRDADVQVLTGSVHSTAQAAAIARGEAHAGPTPERLAEIYAGWAADEDRAVWTVEAEGAVLGEILLMDLDAGNRVLIRMVGHLEDFAIAHVPQRTIDIADGSDA